MALCLACLPLCGRADALLSDAPSKTAQNQNTNVPGVVPIFVTTALPAPEKKLTPSEEASGKDIPPKVKPGEEQAKNTEEKPTPAPFSPAFTVGGELFFGVGNVTGAKARSSDGIWAGTGGAYPSNLSLNWKGGESHTLRLSIGVGDLYTARFASLRQPVEAFYQAPGRGGSNFTVGKFYVPFASQEWEYEPKWGGMAQGVAGRIGYAASVNYNNLRNNANAYLRLGRQWNTGTTLGLSMGAGRGLFSGTSHDTALGVDLTQELKGVRLNSEYNLAASPQGTFQFAFGKLTFTRMGRIEPYIAAYYAGDQANELSNFRSVLGGVNYHITRAMALEGGYARANRRNVFWLQSHVTF